MFNPYHLKQKDVALMKSQRRALCKLQTLNNKATKLLEKVEDFRPKTVEEIKEEYLPLLEESFSNLFPQGELLNVYLVGSLWFGTSDSTSDLDFILVASNILQKEESEATIVLQLGGRRVDISVYELDYLKKKIEEYECWALVLPFHNEEGIFKKTVEIGENLVIRLTGLRDKCFIVHNVCYAQAETFFNAGKVRKSKKRMFYVFRHLALINQILAHKKISDRFVLKEAYMDLMDRFFESFDEMKTFFDTKKTFLSILLQFKSFTITRMPVEATPLYSINFILRYGVEKMEPINSVKVFKKDGLMLFNRVCSTFFFHFKVFNT